MKILVMGATGYLGSNIVHALLENRHRVYCSIRTTSNMERLYDLDITCIPSDEAWIEKLFCEEKIDWVINAICIYHPDEALYSGMLTSNMTFPLEVLNLAIKHHVRGYMNMGTSLPPLLNLYSYSKNQFAEFGKYLCRLDDICFLNFRLELFYGGLNEPSNRFIKSCVNKLRQNLLLPLTEGNQKRDIICVEDIVGIILAVLNRQEIFSGYKDLDVGSGENHSIREIVGFLKDKCDSSSELSFGSIKPRDGEPDTLADIRWYKNIGYELKYGFFEGLVNAITYYESEKNI